MQIGKLLCANTIQLSQKYVCINKHKYANTRAYGLHSVWLHGK